MTNNLENLEKQNKSLKLIAGSLAFLLLASIVYFTTSKGTVATKESLTKEKVENIMKSSLIPKELVEEFKITKINSETFYNVESELKDQKTNFLIDAKGENIIVKDPRNYINIAESKKSKEKAEETARLEKLPIKEKLKASKTELKKVSKDDKILGSENAEVFIVEYSDLECPFCKRFNGDFKEVEEKYKSNDKVSFVFRNFPLDGLHPTARKEAEAVQCAFNVSGSKKSFELKNAIFEASKSNGKFDLKTIPSIAEKVGINKAEFEKCISSEDVKKQVQDDYDSGLKAGVEGTPTVLIQTEGGKSVKVVSDPKKIEEAIEELLK